MRKLFRNIVRQVNIVRGLPEEVELEPTNYCNLSCPLCIAGRDFQEDPLGLIEDENYSRLVRELVGRVYRLSFSGRGEPTLHPNLFQYIGEAHNLGINTLLNTNANTFDDSRVQEAIKSGLDRIHIGLDGLTQTTYERFRRGGNVNRVFNTLERLSAHKKNGAPYVLVIFNLNRYNQNELVQLSDLAGEYPAIDKIQVVMTSVPGVYTDQDYQSLLHEFIPDDSRYIDGGLLTPNKRCGDYKRAFVTWNGGLRRCWNDTQGTTNLGNVFQGGFFNVWGTFNTIATKKEVRQKKLDICGTCVQSVPFMSRVIYKR
ncbi:hypothetical protein A3K73_01375 [Candidatus Pacearchaeota archaeon RBG_13_36_9]|nr:MAG: hypothetical protein A3K73_01375 [Candidatus Pacearchaeota archaeon RBG_13_36_9]